MDGADIILAHGSEAGGHGGARSTLPLVPVVVDMVAKRLTPRTDVSRQIIKGVIGIFEKFNHVRNNSSLAHDNTLIDHAEVAWPAQAP
jgi:hypothetical protein